MFSGGTVCMMKSSFVFYELYRGMIREWPTFQNKVGSCSIPLTCTSLVPLVLRRTMVTLWRICFRVIAANIEVPLVLLNAFPGDVMVRSFFVFALLIATFVAAESLKVKWVYDFIPLFVNLFMYTVVHFYWQPTWSKMRIVVKSTEFKLFDLIIDRLIVAECHWNDICYLHVGSYGGKETKLSSTI